MSEIHFHNFCFHCQAPSEDMNEYLVDHTIAIYLINPKGEFTKYYLKKKSAVEIAMDVAREMEKYIEPSEVAKS